MSEFTRGGSADRRASLEHPANNPTDAADAGYSDALEQGASPSYYQEQELYRAQVAVHFGRFAEQAGLDLSSVKPAERPRVASTIINFVHTVVEDESSELYLQTPGLAHAQQRVIEHHLQKFYDDYPAGKDGQLLNARRNEHLRRYGALATHINYLARFKDLALLSTLHTVLPPQPQLAAREVLAAYGVHYSRFFAHMLAESDDISRILIGTDYPKPPTLQEKMEVKPPEPPPPKEPKGRSWSTQFEPKPPRWWVPRH